MPASARASALVASLLLLLSAETAGAQVNGVFLPPAPQGSGGEDSIETGSGTRCRQSINSNGSYLDMGAVGTAARQQMAPDRLFYPQQPDSQGLVYARVTVPLGARPKRIDCSHIYELELARLRAEVELLKMGAE